MINHSNDLKNPLRAGLNIARKPEPINVIILGGSGDLAMRKLIPSLYNLFIENALPDNFNIIGVARRPMSDEDFRKKLRSGVNEFSRLSPVKTEQWEQFEKRLHFFSTNIETDEESYSKLAEFLKSLNTGTNNNVFYLAIPPSTFAKTVRRIANAGLATEYSGGNGFSRIVVEKPFGTDLKTAKALNNTFLEFFNETQVYRIDHYLGKETVQNIMVFRFANGIFEPLWNRNMIDHIQITMSEDIGIGNRGEYFEKSGVIRDIVQNHIMQLVSLIGMEPPASLEAKSIRDEKLKVIRSIRPINAADVHKYAIRGQYSSGFVGGKKVSGYREEANIDPDSKTETFMALKLFLNNWRFGGMPFYIRTGKRLPKRVTEVAIQFKNAPHSLFGQEKIFPMESNFLVLHIQPNEGITVKFNSKIPGQNMRIRPVNMDFSYGSAFGVSSPDAYERLLLDCFLGDSTLFLRADELEASWSLIDPITKGWQNYPELSPVYPYKAGSWGPKEATRLTEQDGRSWRRP